ncbi:hypothetical protein XPR_2614 [Xanthomonas arboricola pv. pruni MAFF 301420]|uniref:Uncharacterized protein n=1 Tax=Xanthomonas arboricola pv. pruni MAFF 301420 TaxID=1418095 RepID=W4SJ44_9XANT|nr:hypothetical protein XPR_2614 [Xanthomonas arboricola pv. pruni MAFF 301420]
MQTRIVQRIHGEAGALPDADLGHLGFLEIGHDPQRVRHQRHQLRAIGDVGALAHAELAELAIARGQDARVVQIDLRQLHGRLRIGHRRFQRGAIDGDAACVLLGGLHGGTRLCHAGIGLRTCGEGGVAILFGHQFLLGQLLRARIRRAGAVALGLIAAQCGALFGDGGIGAMPLLVPVGQVGLRGLQLRPGLFELLGIDAVVDPGQQLAVSDVGEVLHRHLGDIAADLRRNHRDLAMHHRVLGALDGADERRQPPCIQHQCHAEQGQPAEADHATDAAAPATLQIGRRG